MNELEAAAARVKELAERIVRCAERVESYKSVYDLEEAEYFRLRDELRGAKKALIHAAEGNTLKCIEGFME